MNYSLVDVIALERSEIVANASMNRQRNLTGKDSYEKELGHNPLTFLLERLNKQRDAAWLDLCCGAGRALIQTATNLQNYQLGSKVRLIGIDLVPLFDPIPPGTDSLLLEATSVRLWRTNRKFDLITCVHGLHYVGDKLGLIQMAAGWLSGEGLFLAHLDYDNLRFIDGTSKRFQIGRDLHAAGFRYQPRRHLLTSRGLRGAAFQYEYVGADVKAGANYTGQPSVDSFYRRPSSSQSSRTRRCMVGQKLSGPAKIA